MENLYGVGAEMINTLRYVFNVNSLMSFIYRLLGDERVYMFLYKVQDTPFEFKGDNMLL